MQNGNPTPAPYENEAEMGRLMVNTMGHLMDMRQLRNRADMVLTREVCTFENRADGANEWVQVVATIITDPLAFYPAGQSFGGWMPLPLADRVVESMAAMCMDVIDVLQAHGIAPEVAGKILDKAENHMVYVAKLINDIKTK